MFATMLLLVGQTADIQTFDVNGTKREALVCRPARTDQSTPLVFVFHGHSGNMRNARRSMPVDQLWPEALVIYPQGLPTPGMTDPEGKYNGWQQNVGQQGDRDLAFFDVMLKSFRGRFNPKKVYSMGHSNGGRMSYLLWQERGEQLAAIGPSGAPGMLGLRRAPKISVFAVAGESDPIVPFRGQQATINGVRRILGTDPTKATKDGYTTIEPGPNGIELGTYIFPGGHAIPRPAVEQIVALFKRH